MASVTESRLLSLPSELFLHIMEMAVSVNSNTPIYPTRDTKDPTKLRCNLPMGPDFPLAYFALKRTCKGIKNFLECENAFYKLNTFWFVNPGDLHTFLSTISLEKRRSIRSLCYLETIHQYDPYDPYDPEDPDDEDDEDDINDADDSNGVTQPLSWMWQSPESNATIGFLNDCKSLREFTVHIESVGAGMVVSDLKYRLSRALSIFEMGDILGLLNQEAAREDVPSIRYSDIFWQMPKFRLLTRFRYIAEGHAEMIPPEDEDEDFRGPDIRRLARDIVIDLADSSDLEWLQDTSKQQVPAYVGVLREGSFREEIIKTKDILAKYKGLLFSRAGSSDVRTMRSLGTLFLGLDFE